MSAKTTVISVILMAATLAIVTAISARGVPAVIATNIERIPASIGEYSGTEDRFDQSVYDELDADRHIYRHYRSPGGNQVDFYMGYYGTAKGGRTPHNPYSCLPGSGWGIVKTGQVQMTPSYLGKPVKVNYILAQKGNVAESVIHWYQSAGTKVLSNGLEQNLHRFIGRAFFNRNDGAFIRISTTTSIENIDEADIRVLAFARQIIELLPQYWPEEK